MAKKEFDHARRNECERRLAGARQYRHGAPDHLAPHCQMVARIKRLPGITWEQVANAITGQTGYVSTILSRVYDDEHRVIATIYGCDAVDAEDDGFTLGNADG